MRPEDTGTHKIIHRNANTRTTSFVVFSAGRPSIFPPRSAVVSVYGALLQLRATATATNPQLQWYTKNDLVPLQ